MEEKILTVLTTNYNTSDFIELLLYALAKLTKNKYTVLVNDNGSPKRDILKLLDLARRYNNVFLHFRNSKGESGSLAHGRALDILMKAVRSPYTAVFDSDAVVLQKNWDEILINQLDDQVKIIGSPLPRGSAGGKPADFPFQFLVFFETKTFRDLAISWKPEPGKIGEDGSVHDTAWQLKPKYLGAGYQGEIFIAKNTRSFKQGPFANLLGVAEYYLNEGDEIFASHFGRGSTSGSAKYRKGTWFANRIPYLGRFFRTTRGKREIKEWIKISKNIIDSQG